VGKMGGEKGGREEGRRRRRAGGGNKTGLQLPGCHVTPTPGRGIHFA